MQPKSLVVFMIVIASCALAGAVLTGLIAGHGDGTCDLRLLGALVGAAAAMSARVFKFW